MHLRSLKSAIVVMLVAVCLAGLTACTSQAPTQTPTPTHTLVGTWGVSMGSQESSGGPTWVFTPDGKMIQSGGGVQETTTTYSLKGDTMTLITLVNGVSAPTTMTVQWVSNDQFSGTISGMGNTPLTFRRKK